MALENRLMKEECQVQSLGTKFLRDIPTMEVDHAIKFGYFYGIFAFALLCVFGLNGCSNASAKNRKEITELQTIAGRNEGEGRHPIYRAQAPISWIRHDSLSEDTLTDTTKPLCEFVIMEKDDILRIAIHNFPTDQISERIPPEAQVARWQRQFESLDKIHSLTIPQSFSGYSGLLFIGEGKMHEQNVAVLGWSLQLAPEHYRNLQQNATHKSIFLYRQMRSDVTIKAIGPVHLVQKHKQAIIDFARTFELIKEIPSRA